MPKFKTIDRTLDKTELVCTKTDGTKYDFNPFVLPLKFISWNYFRGSNRRANRIKNINKQTK